jgi:hypothetical protein
MLLRQFAVIARDDHFPLQAGNEEKGTLFVAFPEFSATVFLTGRL